MEISLRDMRIRPSAFEVAAHMTHKLLLVAGAFAAYRVCFHVLVHHLVGIQVGAIAGKITQLELRFILGELGLCLLTPVNGMIVDDEEDFATRLFRQSSKAAQEDCRGESFFEHHETETPPIGEGRNHIAAKPLPRSENHRRLSRGRI